MPSEKLTAVHGQSHSYRAVWQLAAIVAILQVCYSAKFIAQSSFVVEGQQYYSLFDDAMISMRYASNWADGHGLVWNIGERVEGYTNFGWTVVMGLVHMLRLSPGDTCLLVQILGIPVLWMCLVSTVLLARACRLTPIAASCAMLLAVSQYNLNFYTLLGMETGVLAVLLTLALRGCVLAMRRRAGAFSPLVLLGLCVLVRPDSVIPLGLSAGFLIVVARRDRWKTVAGLLLAIAIVAAHAMWRHSFYGEWLPNTYYLKATGWPLTDRLPIGIRAMLWTVSFLIVPTAFAVASIALEYRKKRTVEPWRLLIAAACASMLCYDAYVGGDAWPRGYRFELPTTLALMVLAGDGIRRIAGYLRIRRIKTFAGAATVLGVAAMNVQLWDYALLLRPPEGRSGLRTCVRYIHAVNRLADNDATAAVAWAGAFPYFSRRQCYDFYGKCDAHIARLTAHPDAHVPGHTKFDAEYTVSTYTPDIIIDGVPDTGESPAVRSGYRPVRVEVDGSDMTFLVRNSSRHVKGGERISWGESARILKNTERH